MLRCSLASVPAVGALLLPLLCGGCLTPDADPARATRPYPVDRHRPSSINVQVFREGKRLDIVNATPVTYRDLSVWINQRFVAELALLPAGKSVTLPLDRFADEIGEVLGAGGFWRTKPPTPVRLVEIEWSESDGSPSQMAGLVTIRTDE